MEVDVGAKTIGLSTSTGKGIGDGGGISEAACAKAPISEAMGSGEEGVVGRVRVGIEGGGVATLVIHMLFVLFCVGVVRSAGEAFAGWWDQSVAYGKGIRA